MWSATLAAVESVDDTLLCPIPPARPDSTPWDQWTFENQGNCRFRNTFLFGGTLKQQRGCCLKGPRKLSNTKGRRDFTLLFLCVSVVKLIFRDVPTKIVQTNSSACVLCNMILFWKWHYDVGDIYVFFLKLPHSCDFAHATLNFTIFLFNQQKAVGNTTATTWPFDWTRGHHNNLEILWSSSSCSALKHARGKKNTGA